MTRPIARLIAWALLVLAIWSAATAQRGKAPLVLAAASMQESLTQVADIYARRGHPRPILSFAASSTLARQLAAGAPADLFISADVPWMDDLARRGLIARGTRATLVGNRLVIVARVGGGARVDITNRAALARQLSAGALALADPDTVPAGRYAKAALTGLGVWPAVASHVVRAENVRAAMALVDRGAAPFGIVYATDAMASRSVRVVAVIPPRLHPPIRYPIARLKASTNVQGEVFRRFLLSPPARAIFARAGFIVR